MSEFGMMTSRLRAQLDQESGLRDLDKVVEKYGRIEGSQFSFKGHEFQREIIRDTRSRISVIKPSQVGLSEALVQKTLALCAVLKHKRVIFTLPVAAMAAKFSKDRFDSAIEQSDYYSGMVIKANNSASQKKIGSNMLYIGGTFGDTGAISVPAEVLINDEVDFSNAQILSKLSSRLRHATKDEMGYAGSRYRFSTPTVAEYGIDALFAKGHQAHYMVKCKKCGSWEYPDYFNDYVLPGFDKPMLDLDKSDVENPAYKFQEAWIKCGHCGHDLWSSIIDPEQREWVAKHPDRWEHSYRVSPIDVPMYNTPTSVLTQISEYDRFTDFANFVLGITHESPDSNFFVNPEHKQRHSDAELWVYGLIAAKASTVGGLDVGKICHMVVLAKFGKNHHIIWSEAIPNTINSPATEAVIYRFEWFKMRKLVVDAGPDITLVNQLVAAKHLGAISACQYVRSVPGLAMITEHDDGQLIKADRTNTLEDTMRRHNVGEFHYPAQQVDAIFAHLKNIKKVRKLDNAGDFVSRFEAVGEDHFAHALNYANIARMAVDEFAQDAGFSMPPTVGKLRIGGNHEQKKPERRGLLAAR